MASSATEKASVTVATVRSLRRWIWTRDFDEVQRAKIRQAFGRCPRLSQAVKVADINLGGAMPGSEDAAEAALAAAEQLLAFAAELEKVRA